MRKLTLAVGVILRIFAVAEMKSGMTLEGIAAGFLCLIEPAKNIFHKGKLKLSGQLFSM